LCGPFGPDQYSNLGLSPTPLGKNRTRGVNRSTTGAGTGGLVRSAELGPLVAGAQMACRPSLHQWDRVSVSGVAPCVGRPIARAPEAPLTPCTPTQPRCAPDPRDHCPPFFIPPRRATAPRLRPARCGLPRVLTPRCQVCCVGLPARFRHALRRLLLAVGLATRRGRARGTSGRSPTLCTLPGHHTTATTLLDVSGRPRLCLSYLTLPLMR